MSPVTKTRAATVVERELREAEQELSHARAAAGGLYRRMQEARERGREVTSGKRMLKDAEAAESAAEKRRDKLRAELPVAREAEIAERFPLAMTHTAHRLRLEADVRDAQTALAQATAVLSHFNDHGLGESSNPRTNTSRLIGLLVDQRLWARGDGDVDRWNGHNLPDLKTNDRSSSAELRAEAGRFDKLADEFRST